MTKDEIVPIEDQFPVLKQDTFEVAELLEENLGGEGINVFELERVKVGAGGAPGFSFEKPGGEDPGVAMEFDAIVVHHHPNRTFYKTEMEEGAGAEMGQPDCQSPDAKTGVGDNGEAGNVHNCSDCPKAQWGSHPKGGKGQWCRAQWTLFLYRAGAEAFFPSMLVLPPTSLKPWRAYRTNLTGSGLRMTATLHRFSTRTENNPVKHSVIIPRSVRKLSEEEMASVAGLAESIKGLVTTKAPPPPPKAKPPEEVDYGDIPL